MLYKLTNFIKKKKIKKPEVLQAFIFLTKEIPY